MVGQNRGNDGEASAVAGVDDEQGEADDWRPEAAEHDAGGDAENEQQDVDAAGETVGPPCEDEAAAAVHEAGEGDERRDGAFGIADDVVFHHLLGERNQAEAGGDVEEHEQPRLDEIRILQQRGVAEIALAVCDGGGLLFQDWLFQQEGGDGHRDEIEEGENGEDVCHAVGYEAADAPEAMEQNGGKRRTKAEGDDWNGGGDGLVLRKPQHHRLDGRNIDDARACPEQEAISQINENQRLHADAKASDKQP